MRRIVMLFFGLVLVLMAFPERASAEPRGFPRGLFGIITKPLEILRPPREINKRKTQRRPSAARTRQARPAREEARSPAPAAERAGTVATAATAAGAASAAVAGTEPAQSTEAPAASSQRNAAVSHLADEPKPRGREAARTGPHAPEGAPAAAKPTPTQFGLVGPSRWPAAFEDILGYTFWPAQYGERVRAHGIGDVMSALFTPGGDSGARAVAQARSAAATASDAEDSAAACSVDRQEPADWPAKPIEQAMALNEVQRAALHQFQAAVRDAVVAIRAACRNEAPSTSAARLQTMQRELWAVRDATMLVRAPLINFHRSLSDEQKQHFALQAAQPDPRLAQTEQRTAERRGDKPQIPRELARICGMSAANEWPLRQIEQAIDPDQRQKASLDALQKKSTEMGQLLIASCLQPIAVTPEARLDQALDRLTAMLFAITNITLALNDFHGQLTDGQREKLEPFGL